MIFTSLPFLAFLAIVFTLHWAVFSKSATSQNLLLLFASFFFYGWWNVKLLLILVFLATFTYLIGIKLYETENDKRRNLLFYTHIIINIFILCVYKYFNFFMESFFAKNGSAHNDIIKLIFPLGLSFYTFHNISYIIDIYKGKLSPVRNIINYNMYVSFFPKVVSGPIERAKGFLNQIETRRVFSYENGIAALKLISMGYFKKVVIADNISPFVNFTFSSPQNYSSLALISGAFLYAFQIYADFSGYSDIAKGVAKLFSIDLLTNFNFPYFSQNIGEYWRRWHISLSSWLNDYVFNPIAIQFRNLGNYGIYSALFLTFVISGLWHGEGYTFLIWGVLHAAYYIPVVFGNTAFYGIVTSGSGNDKIRLSIVPKVLLTFCCVTFALIFFRAININLAFQYIAGLFNFKSHAAKSLISTNTEFLQMIKGEFGILLLIILEYVLFINKKIPTFIYYILFVIIIFCGSYSNALSFIYFKF